MTYFLLFYNDAAAAGVKLVMFPKMHQITRKDQLGQNFGKFQKKFRDSEAFDIHPLTFLLPLWVICQHRNVTGHIYWLAHLLYVSSQRTELIKYMAMFPEALWIVKPPNSNNGRGVRVMQSNKDLPDEKDDTPACIQKYIRRPLLIRGAKV